MKYHIGLRTHILLFGISIICFITGIFLIIYGTISLRDANDKLKTVNSYASLNTIHDSGHSMSNKNDFFQKSNIIHDQNSTSITNYLMTLVLVDTIYYNDYDSMAFNTFNTLQSSLTGSNKPARLQILSFYQYQPGNRNLIGKADVYMLVDITYLGTPPLLQDIIGILQQNSIDTLNSINMPQNYYPSQNFNQNCGCFGGQSCPRIPTTTQPPPTTTASCISEKVLCNTIIGIDTSSDILTPDLYQRVINVIEQNISMQIQDFTKYGLLSYDTKIRNYHGIGSITSQSNFNNILSSFKQYPGSSLKTLLQYYVSLLSNINNPIAFISFISEKPVIDSDTINYANQIMSKAKLYFIITGDDLKTSDLQGISSSPPFEFEFGDCNIIGLNETFSEYTICDVSCSPTTTSTTTESTATTSTTTQCIPITVPCNPNLIFAVDSSKDKLDYQFFVDEINYIQYNLSTLFSNYDYSRISLTSYSDNVLLQYPFGSISNYAEYILDLQNILYKNQSSGSSLTNLMTNLNNLQRTNSDPISTYIFISEIDNNDVMNAVEQARILKSKGQLYFIILGIDVRRNQLDPLQPTDVTQWLLSDCGEQNITDFVHNGFICQTDCGTTTTTTTPPPSTTRCPEGTKVCYSNVRIYVDSSNDILYPPLFTQEQSLLTNNITNIIPHDFSQLAVLSQNKLFQNQEYGFGSISGRQQFIDTIRLLQQGPGYMLSEILNSLYNTIPRNSYPTSTFVFLSDKTKIDLSSSYQVAQNLKSNGNTLYFILLGTAIKMEDVAPLMATNTTIWQFSDCGEQFILDFFNDGFICSYECGTTTTSTTTPTPTATPCIDGQTQCNIVIGMDTSYDILIPTLYQSTLDVIQQNISGQILDFSKVALVAYDYDVHEFHDFGSIQDRNQFNNIIGNYRQHAGSSLKNLLQFLDNIPNYGQMTYIVFISENQAFDYDVYLLSHNLKNKGSLQFVILGTDINPSELSYLSSSDAFYYNFGDCNIPDLINTFSGFINCITTCLPTTTPPPSTTRCPEGTKVCYSNVRIYVDSSNDILYPPLFTQEQSLLTNNITNIIPHDFSQLAVLSQNKLFQNQEYGFGSISGRQQFIDTIRLLQQGPGYMLSEILNSLYNTIPRNSYPTSTFVFLSDKTKIDLSNSYQVVQNLKSNGNTLYFILLGTAIKMEDVAPLMATSTTIWQFSDCGEQFILDFFNDGFICSYECGTTTTSTTTPTPTATPCIDGQTQCNIVIGMDTSYDILIPTLYQSTLDVIQQNISGQILDFSKVALIAYDYDVHEFHDFGTIKDRNQFNNIVGNYQQHVGSNLKVLLKYLNNLPNYGHMNYVIFISENQAFDNEVYQLAYSLKNKGNLQFIILGTDINPTDLSSLGSPNSLYYNFGDCNIPDLINSFTGYLNCTNICSSTPPPITTSPPCRSSTEPCNPNLMFAFDASSVTLDEHYFTNEKLFFLNNISSFIQNDPFYQNNYDHIALIPYNSIVSTSFTFGRIMNNDMYIKDVSSIQQGPGNGLMNLLDVLYKQTPVNSDPIATYIFLSNVTSKDIQESIELSKLLFYKGTLSFIIVGTGVNIQQLDPLYKTSITVWSGAECEIGDLLKIMKNSMVCNDYCSTTTTTTTTTTTSTPTTTPCPPSQLICDPNMIFAVDVSSDSMKQEYFNSELALLNNNTFISLINDFKRVDLAYYSYQAVNFKSFGSINNIYEWYQDVGYINNTIQQSPGSDLNSLLSTLSVYLHEVDVPIDQKPVSTYIFISNNDSIYDSTKTYAQYIRSRGSLNFIILGTAVKPEVLQQLAPLSNIIQWEFAKCTIQDVVQFIKNTFTCYCTSSTTTSTTTTTTTTTTTPQQPYVCDVIFSVDSSNDTLSGEDFNYEKSIIINNIPNIIKDFTRVAVSSYDYNDVRTLNFGTLKTSGDFIKFINETTQNQGTSLTSELINLNLLTFNGPNKIPVFIFIGTKDPLDLMNAIPEAQKLSKHVNLYFIIVGTYVKRSDLANLVPLNNIYVWDFANCPVAQLMNFIAKYGSCDSTITTTQQPSPVFKDSPYSPCKSSLVFAISTSEDMLNDDLYENELNLFTNNYLIDEDFNHFERIGIVGYNDIPEVIIQFNQTANLEDFTVQVTSGIQKNRNKGNSLVNLLQQLTNDYFFNYDYGLTKNYFIFITNTTTNDITNSVSYANIINNQNGYLNFIILDTTDPSILKPLNPKNIITWSSDNEDAVSDFLINYIYCTKKKRRSLTIHH